MEFPVVYKVSKNVLEEWQYFEVGSWEDTVKTVAKGCHVYDVLNRYKSQIKVNNQEEAEWLVHSAYFHDADGDEHIIRMCNAIERIGRKIASDFQIPFTGGKWYKQAEGKTL